MSPILCVIHTCARSLTFVYIFNRTEREQREQQPLDTILIHIVIPFSPPSSSKGVLRSFHSDLYTSLLGHMNNTVMRSIRNEKDQSRKTCKLFYLFWMSYMIITASSEDFYSSQRVTPLILYHLLRGICQKHHPITITVSHTKPQSHRPRYIIQK